MTRVTPPSPSVSASTKQTPPGSRREVTNIGGERDAARSLMAGDEDVACMVDSNLLLFGREGILSPSARVLAQTDPYDRCTMTAGPGVDIEAADRLTSLLLAMDYSDATVRHLLNLEGLKLWQPARLDGYAQLEAAVADTGFSDHAGAIPDPQGR